MNQKTVEVLTRAGAMNASAQALAPDIEHELAQLIPRRAPALRTVPPAAPMMPEYVEHAEGVTRVGALSAEAVVRDYEEAAKAIESMGTELKALAAKAEATVVEVLKAIDFLNETAAKYRERGKESFAQIEQCAIMTESVRKTCVELREKLARPEPVA